MSKLVVDNDNITPVARLGKHTLRGFFVNFEFIFQIFANFEFFSIADEVTLRSEFTIS